MVFIWQKSIITEIQSVLYSAAISLQVTFLMYLKIILCLSLKLGLFSSLPFGHVMHITHHECYWNSLIYTASLLQWESIDVMSAIIQIKSCFNGTEGSHGEIWLLQNGLQKIVANGEGEKSSDWNTSPKLYLKPRIVWKSNLHRLTNPIGSLNNLYHLFTFM